MDVVLTTKAVILNCIPILHKNYVMLGETALKSSSSLDLISPFDFQAVKYSVRLSSFKSNILNIG